MSKKIMITRKQAEQFNRMLKACRDISKYYQTPMQLEKGSEKQYGLSYKESLEMAYENIQNDAKFACKGVKPINLPAITTKAARESREMASEAGMSERDYNKQQNS